MSIYIKIRPPINSGSFGTTYYAKNMEDDKIYVIKEIDLKKVSLGQLYIELDSLLKIKENNCRKDILCVTDYYIDYEDQTFNLVSESFISDDVFPLNLRQYMNIVKFIEDDNIIKILFNISNAFAHIHELNIGHGDIKPENILIDKDLNIQIIDFGLSCTRECRVGGTLIYESPEMIQATINSYRVVSRDFQIKSDIFSLGLVFYEIVNSKLPFQIYKYDKDEILKMYYNNIIKSNSYNDDINIIIEEMLSINKEKRPSMKNILEKLNEIGNKMKIEFQTSDIYMKTSSYMNEI